MEKLKFEVVVCGGGLAGICAAISASRLGLKVALVQDRPVLGGNSSSEIRVPIGGAGDFNAWAREGGIIEEIFLEDRVKNHEFHDTSLVNSSWDITLYDFVRREENITLFLNTSIRSAVMMNSRRIKGAYCVQLNSEKEIMLEGSIFIDATGDGTLGASAGAKFRMGRESKKEFEEDLAPDEEDTKIMGSSLLFLAKDIGEKSKFTPPAWSYKYKSDDDLKFRRHGHYKGHWWIEVGFPLNPISDNEKIRDELLSHLLGVWDHIKNYGEHNKANFSLEWVGMVPGKRESRRFIGDYILNEGDVRGGRFFDDGVCHGGWYIDLHVPGGIKSISKPPEPTQGNLKEMDRRWVPVYSIPFRCLYSKNIENLLFAGRNISVTHVALGTTRLMGTCAEMGQAVGTASCFCIKHNVSPREVGKKYIHQLQQQLLRDDLYIPGLRNKDSDLPLGLPVAFATPVCPLGTADRQTDERRQIEDPQLAGLPVHPPVLQTQTGDLALKAKVKVSSNSPLIFPEGKEKDELNIPKGVVFPAATKTLKKIELLLFSKQRNTKEVVLHLRKCKNLWDYTSEEDITIVQSKVKSGRNWVSFPLNVSLEPYSFYFIFLEPKEGIYWFLSSDKPPVGSVRLFKHFNKFYPPSGEGKSKIYVIKLSPWQYPYKGENIINGVSHPEKWTNIWLSHPQKPFPQWVEFSFPEEMTFNTVYLTFDTNLNKGRHSLPPFWRAPSCIKDYKLEIKKDGKWVETLGVRNNYQRQRKHKFPTVKSNKLRIVINNTWGSPSASIYEVRIYRDQTSP